MILRSHGYDEDIQIAGLLHDAHEDAGVALEAVAAEFGPEVARVVGECSERKLDAAGRDRPWRERKQEHLDLLDGLSDAARAVLLADKLHNIVSMLADLDDPAQPLPVRRTEAQDGGDRSEERQVVPEHVVRDEPGEPGRDRALRDHPQLVAPTIDAAAQRQAAARPHPIERGRLHGGEASGPAYTTFVGSTRFETTAMTSS